MIVKIDGITGRIVDMQTVTNVVGPIGNGIVETRPFYRITIDAMNGREIIFRNVSSEEIEYVGY